MKRTIEKLKERIKELEACIEVLEKKQVITKI